MARQRSPDRLRAVWDGVRTSFWFVPVLLAPFSALLAIVARGLDADSNGVPPWLIFQASPVEARETVLSILTSLVTMTSLVFSITMVVLTLAANQFGPRLIRNFMGSGLTQWTLGVFVMTIIYCIVIVQSIDSSAGQGQAFASVSISLLATGICTLLLVVFIHALGRSIVSESVIDRVGKELDDAIKALPRLTGPSLETAWGHPPSAAPWESLNRAGYIQSIDYDRLIRRCRARDALIELDVQPGGYVASRGRHYRAILRMSGDASGFKIDDAVQMGAHRTPVQDLEYAFRHLVEIAVRALSPGTNDPYTAVAVLDRLSAALNRLMGRRLPPKVHLDDEGTPRLFVRAHSYDTLISVAFDQIRQNGSNKPIVMIHMMQALGRVLDSAHLDVQREAVLKQMTAIREDFLAHVANSADLEDLQEIWRHVNQGTHYPSG